MAEPPRDANNNVVPYDDESIKDDDGLIRHINPEYHVIDDRNMGRKRLSTAAFSGSNKPPFGMSVNLERLMYEAGLDPLAMLPSSSYGAVRLVAGEMRELGHMVGSTPLPNNPYHGEVWSINRGRKAKMSIMEKCTWIKKPAGFD